MIGLLFRLAAKLKNTVAVVLVVHALVVALFVTLVLFTFFIRPLSKQVDRLSYNSELSTAVTQQLVQAILAAGQGATPSASPTTTPKAKPKTLPIEASNSGEGR